MPVSEALKRLLRIRDLEQEQHRVALSSALAELHSIEEALSTAVQRERAGHKEFAAGARSGEIVTRHSAAVETAIGEQHRAALLPALSRAEAEAMRRRQAFLHKRMERRQAETLIQEAAAAEAIESARQGQQRLDEWFLARSARAPRGERSGLEETELVSNPGKESSNYSAVEAIRMKDA